MDGGRQIAKNSRPGADQMKSVLSASLRLLTPVRLEDFPEHVLEIVSTVVECDCAAYTEIDPVAQRHVSLLKPDLPYTTEQFQAFSTLAFENPLVAHYFAEGDTHAHRVTDFLSLDEWQETQLWRSVYQPFGFNYQLAVTLPARLPLIIGIALHRSATDFTESDRDRLNMVREHLVAAHRNAAMFSLLADRNDALAEFVNRQHGVAAVFHDDGEVQPMGPGFEEILSRYRAGDAPLDVGYLRGLIDHARAAIESDPVSNPGIFHERVRAADNTSELRLAVSPGSGGRPSVVVAEERTRDIARILTSHWGLSKREAQVADALADALSNAEIAVRLKISVGTVRKHVENIFAKLDVDNRTAVALILRGGNQRDD